MDESEVVGRTCYEVSHRRSSVCEPPDHVCPIGELLEKNTSVTVEHVHFDGGGDPFHVEVAASPVRDDEGNIVQVIHVSRDITERKKAEDDLRDANERWGSLTENTDDVIMIVDSEGIIKFTNRPIPSYTPEEVIGTSVYDYIPREQYKIMRKSLRKVFEEGKPDRYEVSSDIPDVGVMWFSTKIIPLIRDGKVIGAIEIVSGVTEHKVVEEERDLLLKDYKERIKELSERDEALRLLENPLLEVADNVVALPLIGIIDSRRASTMMESLLNHVVERDAELVILDMTGILSVDTATAQHLMQTIEAVRLMGSDAVITGIRSDVAVTLATLGVELADIRSFSTLKEGIRHALSEG